MRMLAVWHYVPGIRTCSARLGRPRFSAARATPARGRPFATPVSLRAYESERIVGCDPVRSGLETWLWTFLGAAELAVDQVIRFTSEISELRAQWRERLAARRSIQGVRQVPRTDSAVARLIELLPETPLVTARTVQRILAVSPPAARTALDKLADAKIVTRTSVARGTTGYFARDVFDLLTIAERRLASTRWDTRQSAPSRPVPALPQRRSILRSPLRCRW